MVRDACFSLSLANLLFLSVYGLFRSVTSIGRNQYFVIHPLSRSDYLALIVNILFMAAVLFALRRWSRQGDAWRRLAWKAAVLLVGGIAAIGLIRAIGFLNTETVNVLMRIGRRTGWVIFGVVAILIAAAAGAAVIRWWRPLSSLAIFAVVAMTPLAFWTLGVTARSAARVPADVPDLPPIRTSARPSGAATIMLLIFDEADYRLLFVDRPSNLVLPELDRFRAQSVFATAALPPSNLTTLSIPALTTGHFFSMSRTTDADTLLLHFRGSRRVARWTSLPNLFSEAAGSGMGLGIVGYAHPYGRLFPSNFCRWYELPEQATSMGDGFGAKLLNQWRTLFETPRLSLFGQSLVTRRAVEIYNGILHHAVVMASDPTLGFKYFHFSVPHSPHIYSLEKKDFSARNDRFRGYLGNLALIDDSLGRVRRSAEEAGLWDQAVVIVTSDHWCRYASRIDGKIDHRVPFLVKMPGQQSGREYDHPFNTVVIYDLVRAMFRGQIQDPDGLKAWLRVAGKADPPVQTEGYE